VVSHGDRAHFDLIALTERELAREESARRPPGENIALGLELGVSSQRGRRARGMNHGL
jgi:hypothetical protein